MHHDSPQEVAIANPALKPFRVLIGNWHTTGTHGQDPATVLHGQTSFAWLENGAFLLMRATIADPRFPGTIAIFGSDDAAAEYYMLTFDARGVSRKYDVTLRNNRWKWWRNAPGLLQRYEVLIEDGGYTMIGRGEVSKDGVSWEQDLG
jgi:hypothetical protein